MVPVLGTRGALLRKGSIHPMVVWGPAKPALTTADKACMVRLLLNAACKGFTDPVFFFPYRLIANQLFTKNTSYNQ